MRGVPAGKRRIVAAWWVGKVLPGVVTSALWMPLWTAALWLSHRKLRRHVDRVTERQTVTLSGGCKQEEGADGPV